MKEGGGQKCQVMSVKDRGRIQTRLKETEETGQRNAMCVQEGGDKWIMWLVHDVMLYSRNEHILVKQLCVPA